jgi:hypothetical protein
MNGFVASWKISIFLSFLYGVNDKILGYNIYLSKCAYPRNIPKQYAYEDMVLLCGSFSRGYWKKLKSEAVISINSREKSWIENRKEIRGNRMESEKIGFCPKKSDRLGRNED